MKQASLSLGPGMFRAILASLVVISHLTNFEIGRPAVFLFFMLSGYWVVRMYEQKYLSVVPMWVFYVSRFLRIWLPFITAFLLAFIVYRYSANAKPISTLWGLWLLGIASNHSDAIGTAWSLDIEMQFYLLVPLIYILLSMCHTALHSIFACIIVAGLTIWGWYLQESFGLFLMISYLPPFIIGACIWRYKQNVSGFMAMVSIFVFIAAGVAVYMMSYLRPLLLRDISGPFQEDWFGMMWVMLLVPLIIWNVQQKSSPVDAHFGNFSYALYITHWPVIDMLRVYLAPLSWSDRGLMMFAITVISVIFYVLVDRPWERFRRHIIWRLSGQSLKN